MRSCKLFGLSRQSVYQYLARQKHRADEVVIVRDWVSEWRKLMPRLGGKKLYNLIKPKLIEYDIKMGRDRFFDYLRGHGLLVQPVKRYTKTTFSHHR